MKSNNEFLGISQEEYEKRQKGVEKANEERLLALKKTGIFK